MADPAEHNDRSTDASGADREAIECLRREVTENLDFEAAAAERKRDRRLQDEYELDAETASASGNCFLADDGTVVDADAAIYDPTVVVSDPAATFDDFSAE